MIQFTTRFRSQQLYVRPRTRAANRVSDVVSPLPRPARSVLAALACFAVAGLANAPLSATPRAALALSATVVGVYATARYARAAGRLRLARTALVLWAGVVAVTAAAAVAGGSDHWLLSAGVAETALRAATWTVLLAAGATTAFLGLQEYGGPVADHAAVEREIDY